MNRSADPGTALDGFAAATRSWFRGAFEAPTAAQTGSWAAVSAGRDVLVVAPTGSGKTLAAFLWALDRIAVEPTPVDPLARCRVLYVSPLKALAVDVERNLRSPLAGIRREAARLGLPVPEVTVGIRTGDTPAQERRRQATRPPDVLITTPESLFLLLTSQARRALASVRTVILDEVHAVAGTKRGAHLALSLERLDALLDRPAQRIGLSATVRPVDGVAAFLGGGRAVEVVAPPSDKRVELSVVVPVEDMADLGAASTDGPVAADPRRTSIWPHVEERVVDLIAAHRSTLVFANSRRLAERLTARLNEIWQERQAGAQPWPPSPATAPSGAMRGAPTVLARAHHGSVSKEQRALIEEDLKAGRLPAVVATSSLELGVDMGAVDLVVQVEAPPSVAGGLQRVGRAGHQVGAVSRGVVFPKYRGDLVPTAVVVERMRQGLIEETTVPRSPLDVLAQQVVATVAMDDWYASELLALVRRAAPFAGLTDGVFESVLDMLTGRYPSDEFAELRPRLVWDRSTGLLAARPGAQRLAVTSGGTIPDRGLFTVHLVGEHGSRVGELDEEMVYESRVGDVFALGATSWRIEEISHDRVLVSPAPGTPGRLPYWHGDTIGRPAELGAAIGAFTREVAGASPAAADRRLAGVGLDALARANLIAYLDDQRQATGHLPDDRTVVVERSRDELGDWRVVLLSPFGARVHAPWALLLGARLRQALDLDAQVVHSDDGIVLRLPDTDDDTAARAVADLAFPDPDEVESLVTAQVAGSALFAARFREAAARALLLPRRQPGRRAPLWQQRQRSAQLLSVAARYASFPVVLETVRECLQDVYDVPALVELMRRVHNREVRVVEVETATPSPFARSLLLGYVAAYLYEGDSPLAERRAAALSLDSGLLAELLGQADLRELLDPAAIAEVEATLQWLAPDRRVRDAEDLVDMLRLIGPLDDDEVAERGGRPGWVQELSTRRRIIRVRIAGADRWAVAEDAGRLRDALGVALPVGLAEAFLTVSDDPLGDVVGRFARTHGPFATGEVAGALGLGVAVVRSTLDRLAAQGRVVSGEFRPGGTGTEWCDPQVLRRIRRRSVAALRQEAEPVGQQTLARFLPAWQQVAPHGQEPRRRGPDGVLAAVEQLAGVTVPASALESSVLPGRVRDYHPAWLDELTIAGEVVWWGAGALPGHDGWVCLAPADLADLLRSPSPVPEGAVSRALLAELEPAAAWFFRDLSDRVRSTGAAVDDDDLASALWDLTWAGAVTNDTLGPLRALLRARPGTRRPTGPVRARERPIGPVSTGSGWRPVSATRRPVRARLPSRAGPPTVAGRWSLTPPLDLDRTRRMATLAETLLERHGVVTRGAVAAEGVPGGFSACYRVLVAMEEAGRCRRAYAVEGLGAAQFALPGAVDQLRAAGTESRARSVIGPIVHLLAAADPANPYGAALPWPDGDATGHRPARKAGALVVLVDGDLVLYVERGGRTLLTWSDDPATLAAAAEALASGVRAGALGRLSVQRADGAVVAGPLADALAAAGFVPTPSGLRVRR